MSPTTPQDSLRRSQQAPGYPHGGVWLDAPAAIRGAWEQRGYRDVRISVDGAHVLMLNRHGNQVVMPADPEYLARLVVSVLEPLLR